MCDFFLYECVAAGATFIKTAKTRHSAFWSCCPPAARILAPQPHLLMDAAPSVTYASARNPVAAIKTAILRTIEERSDNPRKVWAALCASARVEVNSSLTTEEFTKALKYTGTGIQLTPGDTELVLGAEPLTFARFQKFVAENPSW